MDHMRWIASLLVAGALGIGGSIVPDHGLISFKVQLIRATNAQDLLPAGYKPVSPQLASILHGPLKWRHYFRICEHDVELQPGQAKRISLINAREVEIDLTGRNKRKVVAFEHGKVVDASILPVGEGYSFIGGPRDRQSGWFILVRREKPGV